MSNVGRLAVIDRIMAALADGPATTDELRARVGTADCGDLTDMLDDLALAQAIGGRHLFDHGDAPPTIQWVRLLPRAAVIPSD